MNLQIIHVQGSMSEFEKNGIYPEYFLFNLPGTGLNRTIRIKQTPKDGVLKSKGKVLYEYSFDGQGCKFRKIKEWLIYRMDGSGKHDN